MTLLPDSQLAALRAAVDEVLTFEEPVALSPLSLREALSLLDHADALSAQVRDLQDAVQESEQRAVEALADLAPASVLRQDLRAIQHRSARVLAASRVLTGTPKEASADV